MRESEHYRDHYQILLDHFGKPFLTASEVAEFTKMSRGKVAEHYKNKAVTIGGRNYIPVSELAKEI